MDVPSVPRGQAPLPLAPAVCAAEFRALALSAPRGLPVGGQPPHHPSALLCTLLGGTVAAWRPGLKKSQALRFSVRCAFQNSRRKSIATVAVGLTSASLGTAARPKIPARARAQQLSRRLTELNRLRDEFTEIGKRFGADAKQLPDAQAKQLQSAGRRADAKIFDPLRAALRFSAKELAPQLPTPRAERVLAIPAEAEGNLELFSQVIEAGEFGEWQEDGRVYFAGRAERALEKLQDLTDAMMGAAEYVASAEEEDEEPASQPYIMGSRGTKPKKAPDGADDGPTASTATASPPTPNVDDQSLSCVGLGGRAVAC